MARILVTGVTGQIGRLCADRLVAGGHEVLGATSPPDAPLPAGVTRAGPALAPATAAPLLEACGRLDAVIHLAGSSSVGRSWEQPVETMDTNATLTAALVHALRGGKTRLVHASSAEIFGRAAAPLLDEDTPLAPVSPYGVSKAAAHLLVRLGREAHGAPMTNLVLFVGESEHRAPGFVFRKITRGLAAVALGRADHVLLGDTSVRRDFCHAGDFAAAFALLALGGPPGDYVCASGEGHTVREVAETACALLGLDPARALREDPGLRRPADIPSLVGDSRRLRALGWAPTLSFPALVHRLVEHDLAELRDAPVTSGGSPCAAP
jgi:GDPmannose 4,6-dehydratase